MSKIVLQGGGGHARVVLDCLLSAGQEVVGVFDPTKSGEVFGVPFLGAYRRDVFPEALSIIAIGDNNVRKKIAEESGRDFGNAIHSSAVISPFAQIGKGSMILHRSVIQARCVVGNHVIINTGAQVDHDCMISDFVHLAPRVTLCGTVSVGEGTLVGAGAVIIPGKKIGAWAVVGAGSVVIDDIPGYCIAVGNPARVIKHLRS